MIKDDKLIILRSDMDTKEMDKALGKNNIAYVIDNYGNYVGCYTRNNGFNKKSKVIVQGEEELKMAKKIFAESERVKSIPVINHDRKLLYQYIGEYDDYEFKSKEYWENRYLHGGTSGGGELWSFSRF